LISPLFWIEKMTTVAQDYWLKYFYKSLTQQPKLSEPYIFLPLHFQPELTTSPLGGAYIEQELIAALLSHSLPENIKIYIKEHPMQNRIMRSTQFYQQLAEIKNVTLAPVHFSSRELISHSLAVATVTGTAGWEALLLNKPVLMFGHDVYQYAPGVFPVETTPDCQRAVQKVLTKKDLPTKKQMRLFLRALQDCLITGYIDENYQPFTKLTEAENIANIAEAVKRAIQKLIASNQTSISK